MPLIGLGPRRRPFVDLEPYVDTAVLAGLHEEICLALTYVPLSFTGGSHRSMGIVPPSRADECLADYGEVIARMSRPERVVFASLADDPQMPLHREGDDGAHDDDDGGFGEERAHPLSRRQMLLLKMKYGVYFPWKAYYELVPNARWATKSSGLGKAFTREAMLHFPRTVAFVRRLPFVEIGSCKLLGLEANDYGTVHRDVEPDGAPERSSGTARSPDHFISFCPRGDKRLFLWDEAAQTETFAPSRVYWFNDADYHGVRADPFFRYSIRVDGVFEPSFAERLERESAIVAARE